MPEMENRTQSGEKAILIVSFGTSYEDTRKKTIEAIEKRAGETYPGWKVYRAWTSGMIIRKLKKRDGLQIDTVSEAMARMKADGVRRVVVQPTHVINGIENEQMIQDALAFREDFDAVAIGTPLLTDDEDSVAVIEAIAEETLPLPRDTAAVFIGHGTTHYANAVYAALDYRMKDMGYENFFLGTVEAYPSLSTLKKKLQEGGYRRLLLSPFMIVAGDHARHDMASQEESSWKCQLEMEGYETTCQMKGLGEYKKIQGLLMAHIAEAMKAMDKQ